MFATGYGRCRNCLKRAKAFYPEGDALSLRSKSLKLAGLATLLVAVVTPASVRVGPVHQRHHRDADNGPDCGPVFARRSKGLHGRCRDNHRVGSGEQHVSRRASRSALKSATSTRPRRATAMG